MLIIISSPVLIPNEAYYINALFNAGMEIFHLRKPYATKDDIKKLLDGIHPSYRAKLALHQHHVLAVECGIQRIHYTEARRRETSDNEWFEQVNSGFLLSTSVHQIPTYEKLSFAFSYAFFGPVFNSISKQGYASVVSSGFAVPESANGTTCIALGGIDKDAILQAKAMKFAGVAVLGAIWQRPEESVQRYHEIQQAYQKAYMPESSLKFSH